MARYFLAACVLLLPLPILGQPSVSGYAGTVEHGESLTISGASFGTKITAAPVGYDDFDDGTLGEYLNDKDEASGCAFDLQGADSRRPVYANAFTRFSGDQSAGCYNPGPEPGDGNRMIGFLDFGYQQLYMSWWVYDHDWNSDYLTTSTNDKWVMAMGGAFTGFDCRWEHQPNNTSGHIFFTDCDASVSFQTYGAWASAIDQWSRRELLVNVSDIDSSNGEMYVWQNLEIVQSETGAAMVESPCSDVTFGVVALSEYTTGNVNRHYSEIYIDNTTARVEIGNASTWAACTHREIQIPSAWSATEVEVTLNLGTFTADSTAYLFVVDEDNTPSAGYQITIGETATALAISTATADGSTVEVGWNDTGATVYQLLVADQTGSEIFHYSGADTTVEFPYTGTAAMDVWVRADSGGWVKTQIAAQ